MKHASLLLVWLIVPLTAGLEPRVGHAQPSAPKTQPSQPRALPPQTREQVDALRHRLDGDEPDDAALRELLTVYEAHDRLKEPHELLQGLIQKHPEDLMLLWLAQRHYERTDQPDHARAVQARAQRLEPNAADRAAHIADRLLDLEDAIKALVVIRQAGAVLPDDPLFFYNILAECLQAKGAERAVDFEYQQAIKEHPEHAAELRVDRAQWLLWLGHKERARDVARRTLLSEDPPRIWELYWLLLMTGSAEQMEKMLVEAIQQAQTPPAHLMLVLSEVYRRLDQGGTQRAEVVLRRGHRLHPDHPGLNDALGYLWAEQGRNLKRAELMIRRAVAADPKAPDFLYSLGLVLYKQGRIKRAARWLEESAQLWDGPNALVLNHLGDALYRLGNHERAAESWAQALVQWREERRWAEEDGLELGPQMKRLDLSLQLKLNQLERGEPVAVAPIQGEAPANQPATQPATQPASQLATPLAKRVSLAEPYLRRGAYDEGERAILAHLKQSPSDDEARLALAVLRVFHAAEELAQAGYRYGVSAELMMGLAGMSGLVGTRLDHLPTNDAPEPLSYDRLRQVLARLLERLKSIREPLEEITDEGLKLPIHPAHYRLDIDADGRAAHRERLGAILRLEQGLGDEAGQGLRIALDRGDVHWLRGYAHTLSAMTELALAYDMRELFERFAHRLVRRPVTPYTFLQREPQPGGVNRSQVGLVRRAGDVIAAIHSLSFPLVEPPRMERARQHLLAITHQSDTSWRYILAETDNDHEWLPNPRQDSALGVRVEPAMIDDWRAMMRENARILRGEVLLPFWRGDGQRGVNLRRVFAEPTDFDLIFWFQGTAAEPYLEEGPLTDRRVFQRLMRSFGPRRLGFFAVLFN